MAEWKQITNKYAQRCRICHEVVPVGRPCFWLKGMGITHVECKQKEQNPIPNIVPKTSNIFFLPEYTKNKDMSDINLDEFSQEEDMSDINSDEFSQEEEIQDPRDTLPKKRQQKIIQSLDKTNDPQQTKEDLKNEVGQEPLIYRENTGQGYRVEKTLYGQKKAFEEEVDKIWRKRQRQQPEENKEDTPKIGDYSPSNPFNSPAENPSESSAENPPEHPSSEEEWYLQEVRRIRKFCEESNFAGQYIDTISMRPIIEGRKAYANAIPLTAMLHAMVLHWSPETRSTARIQNFDSLILENYAEGKHKLLAYVKKLAIAKIPIMLIGNKGTGKSFIAQQLAVELELDFAYLSLNGATTPSWFFGNWTPDTDSPYKTRPFKEIYRNGGVFCIDEIDAGEPNMLLLINNCISTNILQCPITGEFIEKHPDFIPVATANTFGLGANKEYRGRERLDDATLDRFRMGRVLVDLDEKLEEFLFWGNKNA